MSVKTVFNCDACPAVAEAGPNKIAPPGWSCEYTERTTYAIDSTRTEGVNPEVECGRYHLCIHCTSLYPLGYNPHRRLADVREKISHP